MDPFSSGDEMVIKSRKPYTISKQRERWTDEEHNRFLEAIKLYGRAWQHIEEHIGTKTAVQIRSHAQKFFLKLEKDASGKGVMISEVSEIDIPPPRPKKKPNNPYPRKISAPTTTLHVESKDGKESTVKQLSEFQHEKLVSKVAQVTPGNAVLAPHCTTMTIEKPTASALEMSNIQCTYEKSQVKKVSHKNALPNEPSEPHKTAGLATMRKDSGKIGDLKISLPSPDKAVEYVHVKFQTNYTEASEHSKIPKQAAMAEVEPVRLSSYPLYYQCFPDKCGRSISRLHHFMSSNTSAAIDPTISSNMTAPDLPHNKDGYHSYLQFSSAFSNLVISTLQQNPSAHAPGSVAAATFLPNIDAPAGYCGEFPPKEICSSEACPSIAAVAAATVAAATAWWASNGLIPLCAPQPSVSVNQSCFTTTNVVPSYIAARTWNVINERHLDSIVRRDQLVQLVDSPIFPGKNSAFKPLTTDWGKPHIDQILLKSRDALPAEEYIKNKPKAVGAEIQGSNSSLKDKRKLVRSSSGSNSTSSTELETNVLEKEDRGNEESNRLDDVQSIGDSSIRRSRTTTNANDSWKEVSQEGRVAFRALFARQLLPQKFTSSPSPSNLPNHSAIDQDSELKQVASAIVSPIDLNTSSTVLESFCSYQVADDKARGECEGREMLNSLGIGKLGTHKTGFKLYKRNSVEVIDLKVSDSYSQGKEKRHKRMICPGGGETSA